MLSGRKPKPSALKKLHGQNRPSRRKEEPKPRKGRLRPSPGIDAIKYAREYWDHYLRYAPLDMLKPVDGPLLERMCVALGRAREGDEHIARMGLIVRAPTKVLTDRSGNKTEIPGGWMQNPFLPIVNRATDIARKLAAELGLPVTARARINAPDAPVPTTNEDDDEISQDQEAGDDLDRFLNQHPQRRLH